MQTIPSSKKNSKEEIAVFTYGVLVTIGTVLASISPVIFLISLSALIFLISGFLFLPQILIFLPAFIPFQPALNPGVDIDLASVRLIILGLAFIFFIKIFINKIRWFFLSTASFLVLFFLFWSASSFFVAYDQERFWRKFLVFLTIFPIFFLALAYLRKTSSWIKMFHIWVITSFIVSIVGLCQFLFQFIFSKELFFKFWGDYVAPILFGINTGEAIASNPSWFVGVSGADLLRAISTFPDPHMLAFYIGMSLPFQVLFAFKGNKKITWFLVVLSFLTLLLTFSRGSYVGLIGSLVWVALFFYTKFPLWRSRIVILFLLVFSTLFLVSPVRDRIFSIFDLGEGSNLGRIKIWDEAVRIIYENPVSGVGLGNYSSYVRPEAGYREPIYAHNTYLDIASEIGIPGLMVWLGIILYGIYPLYSILRKEDIENQTELNYLNVAAALGILWFSLHLFFETPIFSPQILPLFLYLVAFRAFAQRKLLKKF